MSTELTRPIIGIENRSAQEVFDIMCDRISAATKVRAIREGDGEAILAASKWHDHHTGTDTTIGSLNALRNTREIIAAYLAASPIPTTGGEKE